MNRQPDHPINQPPNQPPNDRPSNQPNKHDPPAHLRGLRVHAILGEIDLHRVGNQQASAEDDRERLAEVVQARRIAAPRSEGLHERDVEKRRVGVDKLSWIRRRGGGGA